MKNTVIVGIASFFAVQVISLLISSVFTSIPVLKGGPAILLMLLGVAVIALFILGLRFDELRKKENLVFIVIIFGLVGLAYWQLPEKFPQLFSIDSSISNSIKQTIGSIINV